MRRRRNLLVQIKLSRAARNVPMERKRDFLKFSTNEMSQPGHFVGRKFCSATIVPEERLVKLREFDLHPTCLQQSNKAVFLHNETAHYRVRRPCFKEKSYCN